MIVQYTEQKAKQLEQWKERKRSKKSKKGKTIFKRPLFVKYTWELASEKTYLPFTESSFVL